MSFRLPFACSEAAESLMPLRTSSRVHGSPPEGGLRRRSMVENPAPSKPSTSEPLAHFLHSFSNSLGAVARASRVVDLFIYSDRGVWGERARSSFAVTPCDASVTPCDVTSVTATSVTSVTFSANSPVPRYRRLRIAPGEFGSRFFFGGGRVDASMSSMARTRASPVMPAAIRCLTATAIWPIVTPTPPPP